MDLGIVFGLLGTWVLILWALFASGDATIFWDRASFILVVGGTLTTLCLAFPMRHVLGIGRVINKALASERLSIERLIEEMVHYAEIARRDGILALEALTKDIADPFIVRGLQMAVDGTDPELIEQIMHTELDNLASRHDTGRAMIETLGKYAPAFGMIGTLVGLVIMLAHMDQPEKIAPGMAVALLTTLYGAVIANALMLPLADRLARRSAEELLYKTVIIRGVMAIQSGDNPRIVEQKLRTFLPPGARPAPMYADQQRDAA